MADLLFFLDIVYRRTEIRKYLDFTSEAAELDDSWWRTIPTRVVSYPGLYVGAAGCGSSLLRAYAALTGKKLTNLYEYHFLRKYNVLYNMYEEYGNYLTAKYYGTFSYI